MVREVGVVAAGLVLVRVIGVSAGVVLVRVIGVSPGGGFCDRFTLLQRSRIRGMNSCLVHYRCSY